MRLCLGDWTHFVMRIHFGDLVSWELIERWRSGKHVLGRVCEGELKLLVVF